MTDRDYKLIPLTGKYGKGKFAKVSPEDYDYLMRWKWKSNPWGYALRNATKSAIFMHKHVAERDLGESVDLEIDHANRDKLDNRRCNLRPATRSQNAKNYPRVNKTGYRGVHKTKATYQARTCQDNINIHIGTYKTVLAAACAFDYWQLDNGDDFSILNFESQPLSREEVEKLKTVNLGGRNKKTSSKYHGVSWKKSSQKWSCSLFIGKKCYWGGYFLSEIEAAKAYDQIVREHKLKKPLNFK